MTASFPGGGSGSIADGSVTTAKLADGAVTAVKVAADVATQAELDAKVSGHVVEDEGTPVAQRGTLNFTGPGVAVSDVGGKTTVSVDTSGLQPLDADLTAIAGLTPSNDDLIQRKAGAWTNRTPAQVKTDLALVKGDVGLGNVDNTSDANKPVSTAQQTALDLKAPLASPALTGVPTVPTAAQGTNTTQAASTAYVQGEAGLLVPKSLVDAKGDLIVATAADTVARLPVGTNNHVLTADSAQSTGAKWAAAPGSLVSGVITVSPKINEYIHVPLTSASNQNLTNGRCDLSPLWLPVAMTFDRIGISIGTAATTGTARLGIYASDSDLAGPGALSFDAGTVDISTSGVKEITISQTLAAGLYWTAIQAEFTGTTPSAAGGLLVAGVQALNNSVSASGQGARNVSRTGALPATITPAANAFAGAAYAVCLRRSA